MRVQIRTLAVPAQNLQRSEIKHGLKATTYSPDHVCRPDDDRYEYGLLEDTMNVGTIEDSLKTQYGLLVDTIWIP